MDKVEAFLQHFIAEPYNPVKAHEYYLKTRQFKGRSTSGMSQKQKEAWVYSKSQIDTDKKRQSEIDKVAYDKKIADFNNNANEARTRISEKLKAFKDQLVKGSSKEQSAEASAEIAKVRNDLKVMISTARDAYTKAKATLDANYETTYQKEYSKALTNIAGNTPKSKSKAKAKAKVNANAVPKEKANGIIYYEGRKPH